MHPLYYLLSTRILSLLGDGNVFKVLVHEVLIGQISENNSVGAFSLVIVKTNCETDGSSEAPVVCDNKQCGKKETNYELYSEETNPRHLFLLPVAAG